MYFVGLYFINYIILYYNCIQLKLFSFYVTDKYKVIIIDMVQSKIDLLF